MPASLSNPPDQAVLEAGGVALSQLDGADSVPIVVVELCRERALNAVIPDTFRALHAILDAIDELPVAHLVLCGRGRAFCAGGDVRSLRGAAAAGGELDSAGRRAVAHSVLKTEYDFLTRFAALSADRVRTTAISHGVAFGAGAGLFEACATRLVTPRALLSMPETAIGLVPDCGATHFLSRLPGALGMFAALSGARFGAGDQVALGLAEGCVDAADWRERIAETVVGWSATTDGGAERTELSEAGGAARTWIDATFGKDSLDAVTAALREDAGKDGAPDFVTQTAARVAAASPTALRATWDAMRDAYDHDGGLAGALQRELAANEVLAAAHDFEEGVRAALIDKDGAPKWS